MANHPALESAQLKEIRLVLLGHAVQRGAVGEMVQAGVLYRMKARVDAHHGGDVGKFANVG